MGFQNHTIIGASEESPDIMHFNRTSKRGCDTTASYRTSGYSNRPLTTVAMRAFSQPDHGLSIAIENPGQTQPVQA